MSFDTKKCIDGGTKILRNISLELMTNSPSTLLKTISGTYRHPFYYSVTMGRVCLFNKISSHTVP